MGTVMEPVCKYVKYGLFARQKQQVPHLTVGILSRIGKSSHRFLPLKVQTLQNHLKPASRRPGLFLQQQVF